MAEVPDDPPAKCPVCETEYQSVSRHADGVMVNLLENERYRRVCFDPDAHDGRPSMHFYHHTHDQV